MEQLTKAVKMALDMENKGYDLYIKAANETKNPLGKNTLEAIAKKEVEHMKAIEEFARSLKGEDPEIEATINRVAPTNRKKYYNIPIMKNLEKALGEEIKKDNDLEKAYNTAMQLERDAYDFYKKISDDTKDPKAKKLFQFLMQEENNHYELLQETLMYLDRPGDWFKEQERWIVEG